VVFADACRSRACTVLTSAPDAMSSDAKKWRQSWKRKPSGSPSAVVRARRMARSNCHGPSWPPRWSVNTVSAWCRSTCAASASARRCGFGTAVRTVSVFNGSAGYCTAGVMIRRMKSTSTTRRPHASAVRSPANAPSSTAGGRCAGIASCNAHTCSLVAM
jgi:hypothetical protein